jgi:hypothetical protein
VSRFTRIGSAVVLAALVGGCGSDKSDAPAGTGGALSTGGVTGSGGLGSGGVPSDTGGAFPVSGGATTGSGGAPAVCHASGEACSNPVDCCDGLTCNNTSGIPALNGCHPRCEKAADCQTGCCVLYVGQTKGICGDAIYCSCGKDGSQCGSQFPACCSDQICLAKDAQQTAYQCDKRCNTNTDCSTNCCVAIPDLNIKACLDPSYCPAP